MSLDQGTSSSRAIVFDRKGQICSMAQREFSSSSTVSEGLIDELGGIHDAYDKLYKMLDLTETK